MAAKKKQGRNPAELEQQRLSQHRELERTARATHHISHSTSQLIESMVFATRGAARGTPGTIPHLEIVMESVEEAIGVPPDPISAVHGELQARAQLLLAHLDAVVTDIAYRRKLYGDARPRDAAYIDALWENFLTLRLDGVPKATPVVERRDRFLTALDRYARTGEGGLEPLLEFFEKKTPELREKLEKLAKVWPDETSGVRHRSKWLQLVELFRGSDLQLSKGAWGREASRLGLRSKPKRAPTKKAH